jgi:hypothetical protein
MADPAAAGADSVLGSERRQLNSRGEDVGLTKDSKRGRTLRTLSAASYMPDFPEDQFSRKEKAVAHEINSCRADPAAYARTLEEQYILDGPGLINKPLTHTRRHLDKLMARHSQEEEEFEARRKQREEAWNARKEELLEVAGNKKNKGGKKGAPKKEAPKDTKPPAKGAAVGTKSPRMPDKALVEENPEEALQQEQERFEALEKELHEQFLQSRSDGDAEIMAVQEAITRVEQCTQFLASHSAVPWLQYCRALSLTSRAYHAMKKRARPERAGVAVDVEERAAQYGVSIGALSEFVVSGTESAQQIVCKLLLEEFERFGGAKSQTLSFLSKDITQVGVGWGQRISGDKTGSEGLCVIALAERFMESKAIRQRHHLDLQCMIRELEQCQGRQHRSTQVAFKSIPEIGRVAVVEPEEHPIEVVTRSATITLEVPPDVIILASLDTVQEEPTANLHAHESVFVQHQGTKVTIHIVVPHPGDHRLTCFAKKQGTLQFQELGYIIIRAKFKNYVDNWVGLPKAYSTFGELRCFLVSPTTGVLQAYKEYTFELFCKVDREAEIQRQVTESENVYKLGIEKIEQLHARQMQSIKTEKQEVLQELEKLAVPEAEAAATPQQGDKKLKNQKDAPKPKTPQSTKRGGKKGTENADQERAALSERNEQEKVALRKKLGDLEARQEQALKEFKEQQNWMGQRLAKDLAELEQRKQQPVEVAVMNNRCKHLLKEKAGEPHWFTAEVKVKPGNVVMFVDGGCIMMWSAETATL